MAKKRSITMGQMRAAARAGSVAISDPKTVVLGSKDYVLCGLKIPFALEYLLDCSVWPLGTCVEISGESDSNKTTFLFELGRIFNGAGGWLDLILTESKYSPDLAFSLMGWPDELGHSPLVMNKGNTMNEWQRLLNGRIGAIKGWITKGAKIKSGEKDKNGEPKILEIFPGAFYPVLFGIDSLMGQVLESTDKKVESEGASGRGFAVEAGSLTVFLKTLSNNVSDWPFSVVYINHGKVDKIDDYREVYRTPGGNQAKFQATFRIRSKRIRKMVFAETADVAALYRRGYVLELSMYKSSLGEGYRKIRLPFLWSFRQFEETSRQVSAFDWDASLVMIILAQHADEGFKDESKKILRDKLDAICHVRPVQSADIPTHAVSKNFGEEPMTLSELGKKIQESPQMIKGLRDAFGIKCYTAWDGATDFFKLRQQVQQRMHRAAVSTRVE